MRAPTGGAELDAVHGFELAEGLYRVHMLLLRCPLNLGLCLILLLPLHQGLLLRCLHLPGHSRKVEGSHALGFLVFGGGYIGCLYCLYHSVHQVLGCLDQGHGTVHL